MSFINEGSLYHARSVLLLLELKPVLLKKLLESDDIKEIASIALGSGHSWQDGEECGKAFVEYYKAYIADDSHVFENGSLATWPIAAICAALILSRRKALAISRDKEQVKLEMQIWAALAKAESSMIQNEQGDVNQDERTIFEGMKASVMAVGFPQEIADKICLSTVFTPNGKDNADTNNAEIQAILDQGRSLFAQESFSASIKCWTTVINTPGLCPSSYAIAHSNRALCRLKVLEKKREKETKGRWTRFMPRPHLGTAGVAVDTSPVTPIQADCEAVHALFPAWWKPYVTLSAGWEYVAEMDRSISALSRAIHLSPPDIAKELIVDRARLRKLAESEQKRLQAKLKQGDERPAQFAGQTVHIPPSERHVIHPVVDNEDQFIKKGDSGPIFDPRSNTKATDKFWKEMEHPTVGETLPLRPISLPFHIVENWDAVIQLLQDHVEGKEIPMLKGATKKEKDEWRRLTTNTLVAIRHWEFGHIGLDIGDLGAAMANFAASAELEPDLFAMDDLLHAYTAMILDQVPDHMPTIVVATAAVLSSIERRTHWRLQANPHYEEAVNKALKLAPTKPIFHVAKAMLDYLLDQDHEATKNDLVSTMFYMVGPQVGKVAPSLCPELNHYFELCVELCLHGAAGIGYPHLYFGVSKASKRMSKYSKYRPALHYSQAVCKGANSQESLTAYKEGLAAEEFVLPFWRPYYYATKRYGWLNVQLMGVPRLPLHLELRNRLISTDGKRSHMIDEINSSAFFAQNVSILTEKYAPVAFETLQDKKKLDLFRPFAAKMEGIMSPQLLCTPDNYPGHYFKGFILNFPIITANRIQLVVSDIVNREVHWAFLPYNASYAHVLTHFFRPYIQIVLTNLRVSVPKTGLPITMLSVDKMSDVYLERVLRSPCSVCGKDDATLVCSGCLATVYCSRYCQAYGWKYLKHSVACSSIKLLAQPLPDDLFDFVPPDPAYWQRAIKNEYK